MDTVKVSGTGLELLVNEAKTDFATRAKGEPMSKAKYKQGVQITSISEFDQCEAKWYKWHGRTTHRSALMSLQYRTLLNDIIRGLIYTAERRTE